MKYGRVDSSHSMFRDYFKAHGCEWEDTSSVGKGFPDALVCGGGGVPLICPNSHAHNGLLIQMLTSNTAQPVRMALIEIKSGAKAKTKKKTADAQAEFSARFPVWRVATLAEADELIKWLRS